MREPITGCAGPVSILFFFIVLLLLCLGVTNAIDQRLDLLEEKAGIISCNEDEKQRPIRAIGERPIDCETDY
jgi:hypothetical protein